MLTVPFDRRLKQTIEHFPELHDYRVVQRKAPLAWRRKSRLRRFDLINLTEDGREQRFTDVRLHGGAGRRLPGRGVVWFSPDSTPTVARKPMGGQPAILSIT